MTFVFPTINGEARPRERSGHVAVHFNGYLVVWGGYHDEEPIGFHFLVDKYHPSNEVWLYSMVTSTWKRFETSGEVPPPMSGSSACLIGHGMYVFAGHSDGGPTATVYVLDLKKFVWENLTGKITGHPPSDRDKLCCWTHNDKIFYFGGYGTAPRPEQTNPNQGYFAFNTVEQFRDDRGWNNHLFILDTNRLQWSQPGTKGIAPSPRAAQAAAKLGNKAFLFGGRFMETRRNDLHSLNLDTLEWSGSIPMTGNIPTGRTWHSLSAASERHLFLFGGFSNEQEALSDAYILDTVRMMWCQLRVPVMASQPVSRMWHTACSSNIPGEIIIFGGCANSVLGPEDPEHTDSVVIFRFSPQRLYQLCSESVVKNHSILNKQLKALPEKLLISLFIQQRLYAIGKM